MEGAEATDTILLCPEIEDEVFDIMSRKFGRAPHDVRRQMTELSQTAVRITLNRSLAGICRDSKDDFILECAMLGHANLIVTGDKDLLSLGSYEATRILTHVSTWISPNRNTRAEIQPPIPC